MADAIRDRLAGLWKSTLKVTNVDDEDDFFISAGDSMDAIRLIASVAESFNTAFDHQAFLQRPSFGSLCSVVSAAVYSQMPDPHEEAIERAANATTALLQSRPLRTDSPPKQTIAIARATHPDTPDNSPEGVVIRAILGAT